MAIVFDKKTFVNESSPYISAENLNDIVNAIDALVTAVNALLVNVGDGVSLGDVATEDVLPVSKGGTGSTSVAGIRNTLGLGNTSGSLPVANGGTGAGNAAAARENLGAAAEDHTHSLSDSDITGVLPVSKGGTGATAAANARTNLGLGDASTREVDTTPTSGAVDLITSGGVYSALAKKQNKILRGTGNPSGGSDGDVYIKYS